MEVQCPYCKVINTPDARFCAQCGAPLSPLQVPESQPPESLFGKPFEPTASQNASSSQVLNPGSGTGKSSRPATIPEQVQPGFPPLVAPAAASAAVYASPSGVAFEAGGGMSDGRPISVPEQGGAKMAGPAAPKFAASGNRIIGDVHELSPVTKEKAS